MVETSDGYCINGNQEIVGAEVDTHGDHRLAMSMVVAGMGAKSPVVVKNAEMMNESFPEFLSHAGASGCG